MGSFLPLLEGILAFALTMAALTTVVSVLVGFVHSVLRERARGLRDLIVYLYRNDVLVLLDRITSGGGGSPDIRRLREKDAGQRRKQFIVDMTFLPRIAPIADGEDTRLKRVNDREDTDKRLLRAFSRWRSLRFGADSLSDAEFRTRLQNSEVGHALLTDTTSPRPEDHFDRLAATFAALGRAASDKFGRRSRVLSILFGFLLAITANIDSLHLLNAYLTSPELREKIVAQSTEILDDAASPQNDSGGSFAEARESSGAEKALAELSERMSKLDVSSLPPEQMHELAALIDTARDVTREFHAATQAVRRTIAGVTNAFPVGWTLYPNCVDTVDSRCARAAGVPARRDDACDADCVWRKDRAGLGRWLVGVLMTGFLLGLGTPFWVSVATGFFEARNWIGDGSKRQGTPALPPTHTNPAAQTPTRTPPVAVLPSTNDLNTSSAEPVG